MDPGNQPTAAAVESCRNRLRQYQDDLRDQPTGKSAVDWHNFVTEYYSPTAKKSWCFTSHNIEETYPLLNMDSWHCEICETDTGKGFETKFEALHRFFKLKYATMKAINERSNFDEERPTLSSDGNIILEFGRVSEETEYNLFHVVHQGTCRIKFSADLKILSWEFCCQRLEVLDLQRAPATGLLLIQLPYRINELGFDKYFLKKVQKFQDELAQDENPPADQELLQNENPTDDQELPQDENSADDQE